MVGDDAPRPVHVAHFLPLDPGEGEELREQTRFAECELAVLLVQVKGASLITGGGIRIPVVHRHRDAVLLEDACAGEAAGAGADDADPRVRGRRRVHGWFRSSIEVTELMEVPVRYLHPSKAETSQ